MNRLVRIAIAAAVMMGLFAGRTIAADNSPPPGRILSVKPPEIGNILAARPAEQGRIISVRPAIPDGAKAFVEQQRKLEQERNKKPLFGHWFQKKSTQPQGYGYQAVPPAKKPSSGKSFWDIFNPKKWGKPKPQPAANPYDGPQAPQMQHLQQSQQPSGGQSPAWNQPAVGQGQPAVEQASPPNVAAPTTQPGWGG
jgi:hypothetical protein